MGITVLPLHRRLLGFSERPVVVPSPPALAEHSLCLTRVSFPCTVVLPGSGGWSLGHITSAAAESGGL